jgi:hypothetical protein
MGAAKPRGGGRLRAQPGRCAAHYHYAADGRTGLPAAYRGQDFTWRQPPAWDGLQRPDWWRWLVNRQLPRENETIILWARDDLFPDARERDEVTLK